MAWTPGRETTEAIVIQLTERFRSTNFVSITDGYRTSMVELFRALGIDLRFCKLSICKQPFVPKIVAGSTQMYCCAKHKDADYYGRTNDNGKH